MPVGSSVGRDASSTRGEIAEAIMFDSGPLSSMMVPVVEQAIAQLAG